MKIRVFLAILILFPVGISAQIKTNGYLSADYFNGQEESDFPEGSFQNPLMGIILSGQISPKINFVSEAILVQGENIEISQAWLGLTPSATFNLRLGLYLVPFGKYNEFNLPHQTGFINPPLNIEYLFPFTWRDIGFVAEGVISGLYYSVYMGNGLAESKYLNHGQQFRDNNGNKSLGGRIGISFGEGVEATYSYYRGKHDDNDTRNLTLQALSADWIGESYQLRFEYNKAEIENPTDFSNGDGHGYYVQATLNLGSIHPVASYQSLKYVDDFHGDGFFDPENQGAGISEERSRWTLGIRYLLSENAFLKIEYDFNREKEVEVKNNLLSLQIAVSF